MTVFATLLLLALTIFYVFKVKAATPFTFFAFVTYLYAYVPILLMDYPNKQFNSIMKSFALFDVSDMTFGFIYYLLSFLIFIIIFDLKLIKCKLKNELSDRQFNNHQIYTKNRKGGDKYILYGSLILAVIMFFAGLQLYGVNNFFNGYRGSGEIKIGGLGWTLISTADLIFFISMGYLLKLKKLNIFESLLLFFFVFIHLIGGARLMVVTGMVMLFFIYNNFLIKLNLKIIAIVVIATCLFVIFGALRKGSIANLDLSDGFLEFAFVGFGYYNLIAEKSIFDVHLWEFINDMIVYALPPFFDKTQFIYRSDLILSYFVNMRTFSPVGGTFVLSDIYLYFGILSFPVIFTASYLIKKLFVFYYSLSNTKFKNVYSIFLGLLSSFFMVNLLRNKILASSSMLFKVLVVSVLLILVLKAFKVRVRRWTL